MPDLPHDVVFDILSKLPVKSLLRFKCVSKSWLSLISDPMFAKFQYNHTAKSTKSPHNVLISSRCSCIEAVDFASTSFCVENLHFPFKRRDGIVHIIGSCDGLVCIALSDFKEFFIWNPTTRASRKLPDPTPSYSPGNIYWYGFGYDSLNDDYKVVVAISTNFCRNRNDAAEFKVLTTKTGSWRNIIQVDNRFKFSHVAKSRGLLLNGSIHWSTNWNRSDPADAFEIAAFDLAQEKFSGVPIPNDEWEDVSFLETGVVDGCLCLIDVRTFQLWMMKEYGVKSSWQKYQCFVPKWYSDKPISTYFTSCSKLILLCIGDEYFRYVPYENRRLKRLVTNLAAAEAFSTSEATTDMESLIESLWTTEATAYIENTEAIAYIESLIDVGQENEEFQIKSKLISLKNILFSLYCILIIFLFTVLFFV